LTNPNLEENWQRLDKLVETDQEAEIAVREIVTPMATSETPDIVGMFAELTPGKSILEELLEDEEIESDRESIHKNVALQFIQKENESTNTDSEFVLKTKVANDDSKISNMRSSEGCVSA